MLETNRQKEIRSKGFAMGTYGRDYLDYGKIKVGVKSLEDAIMDLGTLNKNDKAYTNKRMIMKALAERDLTTLRAISNYFYAASGIYSAACNYYANLYRYDWFIVPEVFDEKAPAEKIVEEFSKILTYLDDSHIKKICGEIALKVIKNGCYYGYRVPNANGLVLQELPIEYCRSRYFVGNQPAVEFNMKFFDDNFKDVAYRMRVIKMFPDEFSKGYMMFKQGKLKSDFQGDQGSWYLLEPKNTVKFNLHGSDMPIFINAIPAIIDLDEAQGLDRRRQMQQLLKIIVQKLPLDKNGDLIFDIDEARDIHNNAVEMLQHTINTDVLTTFTDVEAINLADKNTTATQDDLQKVERTVYNALGISRNLFNTDGNTSLDRSILHDEGTMRNLLLQFEIFFDKITLELNSKPKKYKFRLHMLETTQYNFKDLSKTYKEHVQMGYSKMLPQVALGHSQSSIINTAYFENEVLKLSEIMIPPLMSSTLNGQDILGNKNQGNTNKTQKTSGASSQEGAGRPEKPDNEKSEKTIQNKESMS